MTQGGYYYDDLTVGQSFGPHRYPLTREAIAEWCDIHGQRFPESLDAEAARRKGLRDAVAPAGMCFIFSLQAITSLDVLPPGVILAEETLRFQEPPCAGDTVSTTVTVAERYERRERKYVVLAIVSRLGDGSVAVVNHMRGVWPR